MNNSRRFVALFVLSFLVVSARTTPATSEDGLLFRWQFDRQHVTNTTVSPLAGSLKASIQMPVAFDARAPQALRFDGDAKKRHIVSIPSDLSKIPLPKKALTVEAWVVIDKPIEWGGIVSLLQDNGSFEKGWLLGFRNTQFCFALSTAKTNRLTYLTNGRFFEPGNWYHLVGTYDGRNQLLYVDGKLGAKATSQKGDIAYPPKGPFTIGAYHDDNELYATAGQIEQVSVWNRALSAKEIADRFEFRKARFPGIIGVRPDVTDWPTYLRDNQRTGVIDEELQFPLHLQWVHRFGYAPQPAWPAPANQDFWHKKTKLKGRVVFDRSYPIIAVRDNIFCAMSSNDSVVCLDASSGREKWKFYAEAPVRLTPTFFNGRLLFGSDDGFVYCLNASDGSLIWKHRLGPTGRRIPGNGRVISAWPVRTGVLVDDKKAFFCAGLFPTQGTYQAAVDIETGRELARGQINVSPQGYLERRGGRLFVTTGRDPAGAFVSQLSRRGKGFGKEVRSIPNEFPFAFVGAGGVRFGGGDGKVAAFRVENGKQIWSAQVDGKAHVMAVARGRLLVSTDKGTVYCFASKVTGDAQIVGPPKSKTFPFSTVDSGKKTAQRAKQILSASHQDRGYCLVLGSGRGSLVYELAKQSHLQVIGVETDRSLVQQARKSLDAAGLAGRTAIHHSDPSQKLSYTDYMFNIIVVGDSANNSRVQVDRAEVTRLLRPGNGIAFLDQLTSPIHRRVLAQSGEWSHMYANPSNTACSNDQLVNGQMLLQWFGPPGPRNMIDRHHRTVAPLYKNGRLFIPGDNRVIAADAYNGTPLWNVEIPNSRRAGAFRDCSYLVAADDNVYVAAADKCLKLNAATGKLDSSFAVPTTAKSKPQEWGFLATIDDLLFGTTQNKGASRRDHSLAQIHDGIYWDSRPLVCGNEFFTMNRQSGEVFWKYRPKSGVLINATITIDDGTVFLIESTNPETLKVGNGRVRLAELFKSPANLVALDMRTGSVIWTKPFDLSAIQHSVFMSHSNGKLVVVGSRNQGTDRKKGRVHYDVHVVDSKTGKRKWFKSQNQGTQFDGSHGEQDHHPVIVGNKLYCEPHAYNLDTGQPLKNWRWQPAHRRGCGTISASSQTLFFRQSNPTMFDLNANTYSKVTSTTRPGCWINMIPAGGLLLVPDASSGCTCNYAIQTSMAFLPVMKTKENAK